MGSTKADGGSKDSITNWKATLAGAALAPIDGAMALR
jgi:hypothetical protein